ncbi:kinase-like domain-containing protein [Gautieria morchelliformis]|nr:kinase-like domain-containing protein [Gautieria morchelliformis]
MLSEGGFGKVKLGLHCQCSEKVAAKLILRRNMHKVLRIVRISNSIWLYDVIETDRYIGIILQYASGGELFNHLLAHEYLKYQDTCKPFAQLIASVSYMHTNIVHHDLKLKNLIITNFGFANCFNHCPDRLMWTTCSSPCYTTPELVLSKGLYIGPSVDMWSCGVILYAMLTGSLPFDYSRANPKDILHTPLTFPDYITHDTWYLLSMMLVPDRTQCYGLLKIMSHCWLMPYSQLFSCTEILQKLQI